uniref:DEK_C domain-containing protein n=1 Tax=Heterorhabditis bacteriophora TaxID=37862 RepID=A0A1I7XPQ2_HETBA
MDDVKEIEESTEKVKADDVVEADGKVMNVAENDNNRENAIAEPSPAKESEQSTRKELRKQSKNKTTPEDNFEDDTVKKVDNAAESNDEVNEENDQVEITKKGLLDLPVEVEGKRHRQKVERLSEVTTPQIKKKPEVIMGDGVALGEVPYIADQINKHSAVELKTMHRVLFGTEGKSTVLKKDIRKFTGLVSLIFLIRIFLCTDYSSFRFAFAEGSAEFEKKMSMLNKLTTDQLKTIKDVLGLHLHGTQAKDALVDDIISDDDSKESDEEMDENTKSTKKEKAMTKKTKQSSNGESDDNDSDKKISTKGKTGTKKAYPSDLVLETVIRELLQIYDLSEVSMKQMCQKVIDKFPGSNLEERKLYLKEKIKAVLADKKD